MYAFFFFLNVIVHQLLAVTLSSHIFQVNEDYQSRISSASFSVNLISRSNHWPVPGGNYLKD